MFSETIKPFKKYFHALWVNLAVVIVMSSASLQAAENQTLDRNQWLKARFGAQHEALIPVVAVADMLFGCQQQKQIKENLTIKALITELDRNTLAEKLITCLAGEPLKSDVSLNYGLHGCFHEQFLHLSDEQRQEKMHLVTASIAELPKVERQKSFTKCVTDQAINYLK
ncbi:MAG: hypothetical protein V7736_08820 [Colwellia polaris]|jgi:hypothetical protein|uniref:hypothetical protein n=1 Tax=Colwellia polaris TaxID=326537 RepID=UPI000A1726DD|nr:hypothetical protein [Colwellia polaris]|tara:strand:- start:12542 stop:13048 length:507 start_codon:yes stop_codon:yes gene_type:complete